MAYTFTFSELASDLGTGTADGLRNIANTAANFVCDAYKNYSEVTTGFSDPTGIGAFNNALFSRLCSPRNKNPASPPAVPFTGGQCVGSSYNVTFTYTSPGVAGGAPQNGYRNYVPGPIGGMKQRFVTGTSSYSYGISCGVNGTYPNGMIEVVQGMPASVEPVTITVTGVTLASGSNNCGNPPAQYPNVSPNGPAFSTTTNVNVGGGAIIAVPILFAPVLVKANAFIDAQANVKVGPFQVVFDAGGVNIYPNVTFGSDRSLPDNSKYPTLPPTSGNQNTDNAPPSVSIPPCDLSPVLTSLTAIKTELDDVKNCSCPVSYTVNTVALGSGVDGYAALPSNCTKVSINITTKPNNAKTQKSNGTEPAVYFCGYMYWGDGTGRSERVPISFLQTVYDPPVWSTAFGWNLYLGYSCTVTATSLSPSKSGAEFSSRQLKNKAQ
jgi:hypothetical protein